MKQLIPSNSGGGVKRNPKPLAHLNADGALVLNLAADALIGGSKWLVFFEDDISKTPAFELRPAAATDQAAYTVTRSANSSAKITVRSVRSFCTPDRFDQFVGHYSVAKISHGLRLSKL